ncbi:MAG: MerR family transcriptional regulator [Planctomycetes bacterium]|nr:MerR family transcriptional regulator [Planctomycetota bacterium]
MSSHGKLAEYLSRIGNLGDFGAPGDDGAALPLPRKLYRMSEVAEHLGLTRQTLHNYVTIGLITEERQTRGGQRLFGESVFGRLLLIRRLKGDHSLRDIRRMLREGACPRADDAVPAAGVAGAGPPPAGVRSDRDRSRELLAAAHLADAAVPAPRPPAACAAAGLSGRALPGAEPPAAPPAEPSPEQIADSISDAVIGGEPSAGLAPAARAPQDAAIPEHQDQAPTDDQARQ